MTTNKRPKPIDGLTERQSEIWQETVLSEGEDHFSKSALQSMLADYCRHRETAENITAVLNDFKPEWLKSAAGAKRYKELLKMREPETRASASLAEKLNIKYKAPEHFNSTKEINKPKTKLGRPTKYTEELALNICRLISSGKSLVGICNREGFPNRDTVYQWLYRYPDFSDNYARAREEQADYYADEVIQIADTEQDYQKARVMIDARKWKAGQMKSYWSQRVRQELTGEGGGPIKTEAVPDFANLTDEQLKVLKSITASASPANGS